MSESPNLAIYPPQIATWAECKPRLQIRFKLVRTQTLHKVYNIKDSSKCSHPQLDMGVPVKWILIGLLGLVGSELSIHEKYAQLSKHEKSLRIPTQINAIHTKLEELIYQQHPLGKLQPLNHGAMFKKVGIVHTSLAYGHIHMKLNLTMLEQRKKLLERMNDHLQRLRLPENATEESTARLQWVKTWVNQTAVEGITKLYATLESFNYRKSHLESNQSRKRKKRQILTMVGGMVVGSIVTSIVSQFRQSTLIDIINKKQTVMSTEIENNMIRLAQDEHDLKVLNASVSHIMAGLLEDVKRQKRIRANQLTLTTAYAITETAHRINALTDAMEMARSGKFSISLVDVMGLTAALTTLQQKATEDGRKLDVTNIMDLTHLPCSYVVDCDNQVVHVIVHVPMSRAGSSLTLYQYIDSPVLIGSTKDSDQPLFIEIDVEGRYLALSDDDSQYQTYTVQSLRECSRLSGHYYCPDLVLYKKQRPDCLVALYDNDYEAIERECPLTVASNISKAARLNATTYLITETSKKDLAIVCNGDRITRHPIRGTVQVTVNRGCVISTDNMVITRPDFEAEVEIEGLVVNNPIDIDKWIPKEEHDENIAIARHLIGQVGKKVPLNLVKGLTKFQMDLKKAGTVSWTSIAWAVGPSTLIIILCCLGVPIIIWLMKKWRHARRKEPPYEREPFQFQHVLDQMSRMQSEFENFQMELVGGATQQQQQNQSIRNELAALAAETADAADAANAASQKEVVAKTLPLTHKEDGTRSRRRTSRPISPPPTNTPNNVSPESTMKVVSQHPSLTLDKGVQQLNQQISDAYPGSDYWKYTPPVNVANFNPATPPPKS